MYNTNTPTGVVVTSSPGLAYVAANYLLNVPIEKWASALACVFVGLQTVFLLIDRWQKRKERQRAEAKQ